MKDLVPEGWILIPNPGNSLSQSIVSFPAVRASTVPARSSPAAVFPSRVALRSAKLDCRGRSQYDWNLRVDDMPPEYKTFL